MRAASQASIGSPHEHPLAAAIIMTTTLRPMLPADRAFVRSGWSSSLRTSRDVPLIPMRLWAAIMHPVIDHALDRPAARTIIAHGQVLQGFVCAEPAYTLEVHGRRAEMQGYVLYLYVALPFRRCGIARALMAAAGIDPARPFGYACRTRSSWELITLRKKYQFATYDPFRARFDTDSEQESRTE